MNIVLKTNPDKKYLLAVSGGIDSMVMADLFLKNKNIFSVAHCNFSLRDEESDLDEELVRNWCKENGVTFYSKKFNTTEFANQHAISIQEAARELRYQFFYELINQYQLDFIATAHHQQDHIETTLFHFFRGTGLQGLCGIPEMNQKIIRPLLHTTKQEIIEYANANLIMFRNDSSNAKSNYSRNYIRNKIIPVVEAHFPNVQQVMANNIQRFQEANEIYSNAISNITKKLIEKRGLDYYIPIRKLQHLKPLATIAYELIKPFGFNYQQALSLIDLMHCQTGTFIQNKEYSIIKNRNFFIITSIQHTQSEMIEIEKGDTQISTQDFDLVIQLNSSNKIQHISNSDFEYIDASLLEYPLILRKWRQGDYLYPLGMNKKKKVARVLIDNKISLPEKKRIWVLESNQKIVWILGIKLDNRFKINERTTELVELHFKKKI